MPPAGAYEAAHGSFPVPMRDFEEGADGATFACATRFVVRTLRAPGSGRSLFHHA